MAPRAVHQRPHVVGYYEILIPCIFRLIHEKQATKKHTNAATKKEKPVNTKIKMLNEAGGKQPKIDKYMNVYLLHCVEKSWYNQLFAFTVFDVDLINSYLQHELLFFSQD